jgi:hypothetical protein
MDVKRLLALALLAFTARDLAAADFCDEVNGLVADGHKGFSEVRAGRLHVAGASSCEAEEVHDYSLGELRCEWRYSRFTDTKLDESVFSMVKGMYECLKPSFKISEMPDPYRFRGKMKSTQQLVDVLGSWDDSEKRVVLYVNILKPDM